jgi:hypothetical protein
VPMLIEVSEIRPPILEFGKDEGFTDPRIGLLRSGPFSLRFNRAHRSQLRLGIVAPAEMLRSAGEWYDRCQSKLLTGKIDNPMYVDFPGFENAFQCSLDRSATWEIDIGKDLESALGHEDDHTRFEKTLEVYTSAVARLVADHRPDVITCCLPPELLKRCRTVTRTEMTGATGRKVRSRLRKVDSSQLSFMDQWETEDSAEELLQRDFRRALKARVMILQTPVQIATNGLLRDESAKQDPATRAWNSSVALFYKAGGIPWRVRSTGPETCYIGVSFHYLKTTRRQLMYSSVAQAFSSEGEGFALRGDAVPRNPDDDRNPHLKESQADKLAQRVIAQYKERTGQDPARVVLHKTTKFDDGERQGFLSALRQIPVVEFVNLSPSDFRLVHRGAYPPKRGTLCRVNDTKTYLFTTGFIEEWNTYPGVHVPVPMEIGSDPGSDVVRVASEVLALARMNWNTAFDTTGAPITLRFAKQVGGIMAEVGESVTPHPSYRFYM